MSQSRTRFLGMDVHKDAMAVAYVAQDPGAEVLSLGTMGTRQGDIDQRIRTRQAQATPLVFVYEAGPCGSWLSRSLSKKDDACWVVAPSLIPNTAGDRGTTDRRDAMPLARLARAGDLPAVSVPTGEDDAMRNLSRARAETLGDLQAAQFRRNACFRRHAIRSTGRAHWSPAPLRWLAAVVGPTPAQHLVLQASVRAVTAHPARLQRLAPALQAPVQAWRLPPVGEALQALRGVPCTVAVTLVAAMGARSRFDTPRALMQCLGVIPAESSSGERRQQGAMTKAGNTPARRARVEGAWASRSPAKVSRLLPRRGDKPPPMLQAISWKAQVRLCTRSRQLAARGKPANVVPVAIARELAGFLWAMAQAIPVTPSGQKIDPYCTIMQQVPTGHRQRRSLGVGVTLDGVQRPLGHPRAEREAGT
jgi:transposase